MIKHLCVIGVGLIGGSLALALKKNGYVKQVSGLGRSLENLELAKRLGVIDEIETDYAEAIPKADVVFISVPMGAMSLVLEKIEPHLQPHTIVTDGASAKNAVVNLAQTILKNKAAQFVPGHPIAGTENSGAEAAFDSLYEQRRVILTPLESNTQASISSVREMWQTAGAEVDEMGARHHDLVLAGTSHLPHVLAFSLVNSLHNVDDVDEIFKYAAGGFRDFTRIASSDPEMWRDICLNNSEAIEAMMQHYQEHLDKLKMAIHNADGEALYNLFKQSKQVRDALCMD